MRYPWNNKKEVVPFHASVISEKASSNTASGGYSSAFNDRIPPRIEFKVRMDFYLSIGRVQNVTESMVLDIVNREWYYDSGDEETPINDAAVETMDAWEEDNNVSGLFAKMVRNWIINGVHIISPKDWVPLQLQSITGKSRTPDGETTSYFQQIAGVEKRIDAKEFLELPYIELDREAWSTGMFDALMNTQWLDIDGRDPVPALALYRQALQDNMKIHHKYASPRVLYQFPDVSPEQIDNDITPMVEGMNPGDRAVINAKGEIIQETVDGNARFIEHVNKIIEEVESGLGSSKNRLITQPSAMADAREAGNQDDDRIMGIMERIRMFMNIHVIPRVTGLQAGEIVFKWGSKDTFTLELPEAIEKAITLGVINPAQARVMLEDNHRWKIPDIESPEVKAKMTPDELNPPDPEPEPQEEDPIPAEYYIKKESILDEQIEKIKMDNRLKNEKIVFIDKLSRKMDEV